MLVNMMHYKEPFQRMHARHEVWKKKYPDQPAAYGGIAKARPETRALASPPATLKNLPFKLEDVIDELGSLPFDPTTD
jgi:arylsulfatase